jgi:hypothetical protein
VVDFTQSLENIGKEVIISPAYKVEPLIYGYFDADKASSGLSGWANRVYGARIGTRRSNFIFPASIRGVIPSSLSRSCSPPALNTS